MLKWIGKMLGGSSVELPEGVSADWAAKLEALLLPIDKLGGNKVREGTARDMLDYVLRGGSLGVLSEVGPIMEIGQYLRLLGYHYGETDSHISALYKEFDTVPVEVGLRWAKLLEACVAVQASRCSIQLPGGKHWPEVLLMHTAGCSVTGWSSKRPTAYGISAQYIESLLQQDDIEASALLIASMATPVASGYGTEQRLLLITDLQDYPDALDRHVEFVRPHLLTQQVPQRLHVLNMLGKAKPGTLDRLLPELCQLGVASSKQVRAAAEVLARRCGSGVFQPLRELALEGKPEQRMHALRLIAMLASERNEESEVSWACEIAKADKAASVQALVSEWDATQKASEEADGFYQYDKPVIDWSSPTNVPTSVVLDRFWQEVNDAIVKSNKQAVEHNEKMKAKGHNFPLRQSPLFADSDMSALKRYLESGSPLPPTSPARQNVRTVGWSHVAPALQKLAASDIFKPVTLLKMLVFFDLAAGNDGMLMNPATNAFNAMHRQQGRPTLLELSQMVDDVGLSGQGLLRNYCAAWGQPLAADWSNSAVWPYFAHHMDHVVQCLTHNNVRDYAVNRQGIFKAIATLPSPPPAAVNAMFELALGSGKTDRLPAQEALHLFAGKEQRIINALSDGKAETRALAAQWIGRLRFEPAVSALEQAVTKEKHDVAKGALLDALQLLGQPVEKYLKREALLGDARKLLAKGLPKDLDWFPWSALPEVRWSDTLEVVPEDVIRWMLVQSVKQKSPEPNAILRKYCGMLEPRDRERLGQFVLETWLREDIKPISADVALSRAQSQAKSTHAYMTQYPQYNQTNPHLGKSIEELTAAILPSFLRQPEGSAIGSKGLLAVAAACAAERAAAPVQRYLKEWYGSRAAQGKALIAMLAWVEHPGATQLMLSIGSRFRTKSFQEEATRQAEALADRKGWTLGELADRTIPSAGFDETGAMELSYGSRSFTAHLLPDFKVELFNPDGKKVVALPDPRQDDDEAQAKEAKRAFSNAKKEIKGIVSLQSDRLYEALCTGRDWSFNDWQAYLNAHPVMRHLVQRLVWVHVQDGAVVQAFRPLDDGTLTDRDDNEIVLADDARVQLAHDYLLAPDEVQAWQQHLVDYGITPLFQQLGKGTYALPADKGNATEILDFKGHLLEAYALRGRALKLGYTRGTAEDGGWFHVYQKRFPTLGLEAVIEFTGNPLPEENRTVALLNLSFCNSAAGQSAWQNSALSLNKVPKVLLSECYNDLRLIASEGSGFDSDWEKKSEY